MPANKAPRWIILYFSKMDTPQPQSDLLITLVRMKMPFGKYKGVTLCDLPVSYLEWFQKKGFPPGKMGMLLATIYEIKINGLTHLLEPLKRM
jgi:uncharacterized protein (DUF3820 family)